MRRILPVLAFAVGLMAVSGASAQDRKETLADIRQQLTVLFVELRQLKTELSTTSAPTGGAAGATLLTRVDAMESEIQRLTAKAEELEFRIDRIVTDGTNRIGDLEFRLCELETDCDIASLGETPSLGGEAVAVDPTPSLPPQETAPEGPELAVGEASDFEQAQAALADGDYEVAADAFLMFKETYPGSPLSAAADLGRGDALENLGDTREAARAYLDAFTADQLAQTAPVALFKLGAALGRLGQVNEACVTLSEVALRYPDAAEAIAEARAVEQELSCG